MPSFERLKEHYAGDDVSILLVNAGESRRAVTAFMQDKGYSFSVLLDSSGLVGRSYGILAHPATVIIDKQGRIVFREIGYRDWYSPEARELLETLIRE